MVENQDLNFTQFVNDQLEKYFSVTTTEEIDRRLEKLREEVVALETRKAALLVSHRDDDTLQRSSKLIWDELHKLYGAHRDQDADDEKGVAWITSPKNLKRCNLLSKQPAEILAELRRWFDNGGK
jgi:hypothetical protein